jgi:HD-like signal output (HDOD) protein
MTSDLTATTEALQRVFGSIADLAAQRPIAAQLITAADTDDADAKSLAGILSGDIALSARVMKLANSAYFGMRGKVASLQLAVTVVGFATVRTIATVALTDLDDESRLPEDFWKVSTGLAVAASGLAPRFGARPAEAMCLGVLAQLGSALLFHNDRHDYAQILSTRRSFAGRRIQEIERYGVSADELTAMALETWSFPEVMLVHLRVLNDQASSGGGLLRACYEVVSRLMVPDHRHVRIDLLTRGKVREDDLAEVLHRVRNEAEDLQRLLVGE